MPEQTTIKTRKIRHRGRLSQISIYLGKLIRLFVFQNDWIVLPMSGVIAGMVSMVIRRGFGINMEGTLKGAFALSCVAIWNGCFNSIQVICRERHIIKREHRSGMHITSYVLAHMLYQAILCLLQAGLTVYICLFTGVQMKGPGIVTSWMILDIGISIFIISYVSDLMALLISAFVHSTTAAMTIMPFILIFQLVFSGGIFTLPGWAEGISKFTISNYGMSCIGAQARYNDLPMITAWTTIEKLEDKEIGDSMTVGDIIKAVGEDEIRDMIVRETAAVSKMEKFDGTEENVIDCWAILLLFGMGYGTLTIILLEFIDKDKR